MVRELAGVWRAGGLELFRRYVLDKQRWREELSLLWTP